MKRGSAVAILAIAFGCWHEFDGSGNCLAQVIGEYELGGASRPKPDMKFRDDRKYKRVHQTSLRFILRDELDRTERFLQQFLKEHPNDPETLYMLGLLNARRGDLPAAESYMQQAIDAGLPDGRIVAGPRAVIEPLADSTLLRNLRAKYSDRPVHGPLLGSVTDSSVAVWVRTATEANVKVIVGKSSDWQAAVARESGRSSAAADFTTVVTVGGLDPDTKYHYGIQIDDGPIRSDPDHTFRTCSAIGQPTKFSLAFGGGAGYVPENERMWDTIHSFDPLAILLLGDNVYIDDPESIVMQQYTYQRRQSRPEWRRLTAGSPVFTIWDDHDFSTNDSWGGPDVAIPFWKRDWVFPIFRQNWANPGYGGGDAQPGCYYTFRMGDVDFIMLDCRYYRTDPKKSPRTMLGPVQLAWLKEQLQSARGTFKVLCSSVPWDFRTKGDSLDTWNGYRQEHEEILGFIDQHRIEGVVLVSADRHRSDAWKLSRPEGYDLYEFNSSRLTNQHIHPTMEKAGAIFSYNDPQSFGLVTFDTTLDDPTVTYQIVNINGQSPYELTVRRSQLNMESGQ